VICLEPEAAGSSPGMIETFRKRSQQLGVTQVTLLPITFQEYQTDQPFDVLFCHDAINHLDEEATIHLHQSEEAQKIYLELFRKMYHLCAPGGYLIIADASRHSLYSWLRVRSPLTPTIEWHKHQPPQVWSRLLNQVGFKQVALRWRSPTSLGYLGQLMIGNRFVNFFLWAHFCLTMRKVG
jgi:SAM-dependent methyltransferase